MALPRIPAGLERAISVEIEAADPRALERASQVLSERYRGLAPPASPRVLVRGREEVRAYAARILPAAWAETLSALEQTRDALPGFAPRTLLDLGSGPGTAAWAAAEVFPSLADGLGVEREAEFRELAARLAHESLHPMLAGMRFVAGDLGRDAVPSGTFDLVVLGHVLPELGDGVRARVVEAAWRSCGGLLVAVAPGTPDGFATIRECRDLLLRAGAHVAAPCPHDGPCPMAGPAWCHFARRTERPVFQRRAKGASLPWEDARYSFVAASREAAPARPWARMLHEPRKPKGRLELSLCTVDGLAEVWVRRGTPQAAMARELSWGSAVSRELAEPPSTVSAPRTRPLPPSKA